MIISRSTNYEKGDHLRQDFRNMCSEIEEGRRRDWRGADEPEEEQLRFLRRETLKAMLVEEEKSVNIH